MKQNGTAQEGLGEMGKGRCCTDWDNMVLAYLEKSRERLRAHCV